MVLILFEWPDRCWTARIRRPPMRPHGRGAAWWGVLLAGLVVGLGALLGQAAETDGDCVAQLASLKSAGSLDRLEEARSDWRSGKRAGTVTGTRVRADTHEFGMFEDDLTEDPRSCRSSSPSRDAATAERLIEELATAREEITRLRARLAAIADMAADVPVAEPVPLATAVS